MKQCIVLICACCCCLVALGQASKWAWAASGNNVGKAGFTGVAEDGYGNIYATGSFAGSISFDTSNLLGKGSSNLFLAKYTTAGKLVWLRAITSSNRIESAAITADKNGEVYISGKFKDTAYLGGNSILSKGDYDIFLAKYTPQGNLSWVRSYGTPQYDGLIRGLALDAHHNTIIGGSFSDTSPIQFGPYSFSGGQGGDIFLTKIDSAGQVIWAKHYRGNHISDIATDKNDNIYVAGGFSYSIWFDSLQINSVSSGFVVADNFIVKCDSDGTPIWGQALGGNNPIPGTTSGGAVQANCIAVDTSGNVIVGGSYSDCAVVVPGLSSLRPSDYFANTDDIWFAKFSTTGAVQWARSACGIDWDELFDVATDRQNNIYIAGYYGFECDFSGDTLVLTPNAYYNLYVCKYAADGTKQWLKSADDGTNTVASALTVSPSGAITIVGGFTAGSIVFGSSHLSDGGSSNGFVARMEPIMGILTVPKEQSGFTVFPNPADHELSVRFQRLNAFKQYALYDVFGHTVLRGAVGPYSQQTISLPALAEGLYFLRLSGPSLNAVEKIYIR